MKLYTEDSTQISLTSQQSLLKGKYLIACSGEEFFLLKCYLIILSTGSREKEIDIYRVHLNSGLPAPDVCSKPSDYVSNSCGALALPLMVSALVSNSLAPKEDKEVDPVGLTGLLAAQC